MVDLYQLPSLKNLSQDEVDQSVDLLTERVTEFAPDIDFNAQAARRLIPYLHGLLFAGTIKNLTTDLATATLAAVQAGTASDEQVDQVAARFGVTRRAAVANQISVLFIMNSSVPFGLATSDVFSFNGVTFSVASSISVRSSSATTSSPNDYVLTQIGNGKWGVVVPMTARLTGAAGNVFPNSTLSASKTITGLNRVSVLSSTGVGADAETSAQVAARILAASSIVTWASRSSFEAIARKNATYSSLVAVSVAGYGDTEQRRDRRGVLPVSYGGKTDVYCKFRPSLYSAQVPVTAVLTGKTGTVGTWSFTLNGQTYPGVYRVESIVPEDDQSGNTFAPNSETTSLGVPAAVVIPRNQTDRYVPDVVTADEAAYSAYANVTVLFDDTNFDATSTTVGTSRNYLATIYYEPLVDSFQQLLGGLAASNPAGDVLVKAAIPCEVVLSLRVAVYKGSTAPSASAIRSAAINFVASLGFVGGISASDISTAIGKALAVQGTISVLALSGRIKKPDGSYLAIDSIDGTLTLPDLAEEMVSGNTVAFYTDTNHTSVTIV